MYSETHQVTSNIYGLINLVIGEGIVEKGDFESIVWGKNSHYIKMEMDTRGGTDYRDMGASQLYAVPYALYAEEAGSLVSDESGSSPPSQSFGGQSSGSRNGTPNTKFPADDDSFLNVNTGKVGIGKNDPQEKLDVTGKIMASQGFNTNGNEGLSDSLNIVTDIDFNNSKLKYRSTGFSGGMQIYLSETSAWIDTVGNIIYPFPCGDSLIDIRDGQKYATVLIGPRCWMAQNMNIGTRINGTQEPTDPDVIEKYCYADNDDYCDTLGGLYQWNEMMEYVTTEGAQGICPAGWHIPTDNEWKVLEGTVDGLYPVGDAEWDIIGWRRSDAGKNLKSTFSWVPSTGTDLYGFNALAAGRRKTDGIFNSQGVMTYIWVSMEYDGSTGWCRYLRSDFDNIRSGYFNKSDGRSVRCILDCTPQPIQSDAGPDQLNVPDTVTTLAGNTPTSGTLVCN